MTKDEFLNQLDSLDKIDNLESCAQLLETIDEYSKKVSSEEKEFLETKKIEVNIRIITLKINQLTVSASKEEINLRGKLVKLYKKLEKKQKNLDKKNEIRYKGLEELRLQKEAIKKYKSSNTKIPITEKLGLNILQIAKSVEVFVKEKDIIQKAKNIVKETASGVSGVAVTMGAIGLGLQALVGMPLTLSTFISAFPVAAYIGLASIIRNLSSKTPFEQYQYQQSEEYQNLVKKFYEENKDLILSIAKIVKEKESVTSVEAKITVNENFIAKIDEIIAIADIKGVRDVFALQALSSLRENKELCEQIKDEYLDEKNDDKEKYKLYCEKLRKINFEIFKRANSINDAIINSGKFIVKNTAVMAAAKAILSCIIPGYFPLTLSETILEPFAFSVINGLIDIPTYRNKLKYKETEYKGKIKAKNKKRIEEILEMKEKNEIKEMKPALT